MKGEPQGTITTLSCNLRDLTVTAISSRFFVRIVKEWNDLSECVVEAGNLRSFKGSLRSFFTLFGVFFGYFNIILNVSNKLVYCSVYNQVIW